MDVINLFNQILGQLKHELSATVLELSKSKDKLDNTPAVAAFYRLAAEKHAIEQVILKIEEQLSLYKKEQICSVHLLSSLSKFEQFKITVPFEFTL